MNRIDCTAGSQYFCLSPVIRHSSAASRAKLPVLTAFKPAPSGTFFHATLSDYCEELVFVAMNV